MTRLFPILSLVALGFLALALLLGLGLGDVRDAADLATQRMATVHRLSGLAAALVVLLVDSVSITYFVGTSRWCKEVSETYRLGGQFVQASSRLKRRAFPLAVISMLVVVGIVALGGAADPGATRQVAPLPGLPWPLLHKLAALLGGAFIAAAYFGLWLALAEQARLVGQVMAEVRRIRLDRGLDVDDPPA